jgi:hypothetical protein
MQTADLTLGRGRKLQKSKTPLCQVQTDSFESSEHIAEETYLFLAGDWFQDLLREQGSEKDCWSPKKLNAQ